MVKLLEFTSPFPQPHLDLMYLVYICSCVCTHAVHSMFVWKSTGGSRCLIVRSYVRTKKRRDPAAAEWILAAPRKLSVKLSPNDVVKSITSLQRQL